MKKLSIIAALLLGASVASAQTTTTQEDIKAYVNDQITDAVTQLSKTDGDLQTQIKTLEQQVAKLSAMVEAANLNNFADYFESNSNTLSAEEVANLTPVIEFLQKNASATVIIEGYADERGTREYNLGLGKDRAESVKQILVNNGVVADRIGVLSYGKERPICIDSNEGCWRINRRAQFNIRF
jgi:peptidoglycan-associated lipoprotein